MVVGLGNPGNDYQQTRHNAGFLVIDALASHYKIDVNRSKFDALYGRGVVKEKAVILLKPMAFMNRSGPPVQRIAHYFKILLPDILVVHDDIDLSFGRLKIKQKGGDGGHRGIRSIMDAFGGGEFTRLRMGIGRSGEAVDVVDHVLGRFNNREAGNLTEFIDRASEAAVKVLCDGVSAGMNQFNRKSVTNF